jgi:transaldolase
MASNKNTLQQLHDYGQSPWIDFISRELLTSGRLKELIEQGIVGETSNPTIFQQAIGAGNDYDDELRQLVRAGKSVSEIYDSLVLGDIRAAATILRPIYDQTHARDGYVSIEEPPDMAYDTQKAIEEAHRLFTYLNLPNIMIKIPGTPEGIPAFQQAISEGINVNVTLVFSLDNYRKVAQAYIAGLEARAAAGKPIDTMASVASFFVSRVDTTVDQRLDELISYTTDERRKRELKALQGKAAIANAKLAYAAYQQIFSGPRWEALARQDARTQRCLWASTSTKNPAYRDILYAEQLIGPDTVDTMPLATIEAFLDHAIVARTLDQDVEKAREDYVAIERAGIPMDKVTLHLQQEGVQKFADSFNQLIDTITAKREQMMARAD